MDVVIIGAGASGMITALHLSRCSPRLRVALVDQRASTGRGLAYGSPLGEHLLNVPAANMSALPSLPEDFWRWLEDRLPESTRATFASRRLYGDYLLQSLERQPQAARPLFVHRTAVGVHRVGRAFVVHLDDGQFIHASVVVLATGHLKPNDPLSGTLESRRYVRDPWLPELRTGLNPGARVMLLGSGLTMVDTVLTLRAEGVRSPIHVLSRHGALPAMHRPATATQPALDPPSLGPAAMLRWLRRGAPGTDHRDWRAVMDALRPHTARIWQQWTPKQRRSFLSHARWAWDVHRHRMAPQIADEIRSLIAGGDLVIHRGRLRSVRESPSGLAVRWEDPQVFGLHCRRVHRLVNCTGPGSDYRRSEEPLIRQLRLSGLLTPDTLGLGIQTDAHGQLLDRAGNPVPGLTTLGPTRRGSLWESTAIPEIRLQAEALARMVPDLLEKGRVGDPWPRRPDSHGVPRHNRDTGPGYGIGHRGRF